MTTHKLKCWPKYYEAVIFGKKTFEVRLNDRGFSVDDSVILNEWSPTDRQ
jgi:ASC-1-like (ASCH) protein